MNKYDLRITFNETIDRAMVSSFMENMVNVKCVGAYELGDVLEKPHCHFYIETDLPIATIRNRLTRTLKVSGNRDYKLRLCDDGVLAYNIKDKDIMVNTLFTEEELFEKLSNAYNSKNQSCKNSKINKLTYLEDMIEKYQPLEGVDRSWNTKYGISQIQFHVAEYVASIPRKRCFNADKQTITKIFNNIIWDYYPHMNKNMVMNFSNNNDDYLN